jgi:hypothetical protein
MENKLMVLAESYLDFYLWRMRNIQWIGHSKYLMNMDDLKNTKGHYVLTLGDLDKCRLPRELDFVIEYRLRDLVLITLRDLEDMSMEQILADY